MTIKIDSANEIAIIACNITELALLEYAIDAIAAQSKYYSQSDIKMATAMKETLYAAYCSLVP